MQSLFTFCKARWARRKENHATKGTKIPKNLRVYIPEEAPEDAIGDKVSSGKVEAV